MMVFTINLTTFSVLLYLFTFNNSKSFVFCQYPTDYFDIDNAISTDGNAYYHSKARQYENTNQDADIGATATLLVGGAALLGALGIVGIASLQGLRQFNEKIDKHEKTDECCKHLEQKLTELRNDFEDEEDEQDRIESRQRGLCNLANQLGQLNIGDAEATMGNAAPTGPEFNMLVSKVNEVIGRLESLPNGGCSIVK